MADISNECIIGLDTMKMFKMVMDVGTGMIGVNGKVLPGCLTLVLLIFKNNLHLCAGFFSGSTNKLVNNY